MPVLFIGHGSPMNAVETNSFTQTLGNLGKKLPKPDAIVCVSAHWMTDGIWVTHMAKPRTIHDFYGFPKELFEIQYPAPGSPKTAELIKSLVRNPSITWDDQKWGLDHGTWSVLKHLYPNADIPTIQLSICMKESGEYHYQIGEQLKKLRDQGVLILGSGNIVHNLRVINFDDENAKPFDWATEFDEWSKKKLLARDHHALCTEFNSTSAGKMSVPTVDHYYPLLPILGASDPQDAVSFEYEGMQNASISMRAVGFGIR
ncbi:4,5-DOPA dioxygenase extradiol [bacterium]|nr:4,5-DOPA dioxygenase extradiol [bacterium]